MSCCTGAKIRMKRIAFFSLLVSMLFFFFNLIEVSFLFYLGLAGLLMSIFVLTEKEMFLMISFLVPNLFMFKQLGSDSALLGYFFILASAKSIMKVKCNVKINLFLLSHIAFALLTCIIYFDRSLLTSLVRFVCNFCFFTYCATLFSCNGEIKQVIKMYFIGIISAILMGVVFHSVKGDLFRGFFGGINSGRNYFGAVITPAITIAVLYFLEKRASFSDLVIYGATIISCLISIILSHSRTSVLTLVFPVLLCLFCTIRPFGKINKKLFPFVLLILVIILVVYMNYQDMILSLLSRFNEDDLQTGNSRFTLWRYYLNRTLRNPITFLFGNGSAIENMQVEHNTLVQCFHQLGAMGSITLLGFIQQTFKKITKGNGIRMISFFPLLSVIFPYCGISALYSDQLSYLIVLCALIMKDFPQTGTVKDSIATS